MMLIKNYLKSPIISKHKRIIRAVSLLFLFFLLFLITDLIFPFKVDINYSTMITDSKGNLLHAYLNNTDKWRMYTELEEITPTLKKAIVFKEDRFFYYHPGINPVSVVRAVFKNMATGKRTSGASTITMQVARLVHPKKRTYLNKMSEMFNALQLEWHYSKSEIFQMYLNLVPYGGNVEGVKAASLIYFNKMPDHLSIGEITALSIIPNRPNTLRPDNTDVLKKERNKWLNRFLSAGLFPVQDIQDALAEPVSPVKYEIPYYAPHLCNRLFQTVKNGHTIHSSIQLETQLKVEALVREHINRWYFRNVKNAAALVIDNTTGDVIAYAGSADFFNDSDGGQVDGIRSVRSPGSTLKPLIYGLAIDRGLITPKMVVSDVPVYYSGYEPENYDGKYHGLVSIEYALSNSLNIPAVKIMNDLGNETVIRALVTAGFKQVQKDRNNLGLSLALGGCGVTLEEITRLYYILSHQGEIKPIHYIKTTEKKQKKDDKKNPEKITILSESASFLITEILTSVTRPDLPLEWQNSAKLPKVAWKTGTSYGRRDAWSIGYNKNFTVGVWVGNFSGEGVPELSGAEAAAPLLFNIFNLIDYGSETNWYEAPEELRSRVICTASGNIPSEFCTDLSIDYYIPGISPANRCSHLKKIYVSPDSAVSYCLSCRPATGYIEKYYPNYSPGVIAYYDQYHIHYQKIPPHQPECSRIFSGSPPIIISPQNDAEYFIDETDTMQIALRCNAAYDVEKVFWYINRKYYQSALPDEKIFFSPAEGKTEISCSDDKGRNSDVFIIVKKIGF